MINSLTSPYFLCFRNGYFVVLKNTAGLSIRPLFVSPGGKTLAVWVMLCCLLSAGSGFGGNTRTQTFQLNEGWNSIWLAVDPIDTDPAAVFNGIPVDVVAVYNRVSSTQQFTTDPAANMLTQLGWSVWYAPERPDSFLTELGGIHTHKAYLVHATSDCILNVEGEVEALITEWQPNAFNLRGFCLDSLAPPGFSEFFSASKAHQELKIYRLVEGTWRKVTDPENEAMRSGEAFWIYSAGASDYQGPLRLETKGYDGVVLTSVGDEIILHNEAAHPLSPVIHHVVSGSNSVPIAVVVEVIDDAVGIKPLNIPMDSTDWTIELPPLESGGSARIPLALQADKMTETEAYTLLCIKTDLGTETWLSVLGLQEESE